MPTKTIETKVRFDGGENPKKWISRGLPEGVVPDQYVNSCVSGGRNLHILMLGQYHECYCCEEEERKICKQSAANAGEQRDCL